jgi:hypothetical protein
MTPNLSSYGNAKQTDRRLIEFLDIENPEIKAFSLDLGIKMTDRTC